MPPESPNKPRARATLVKRGVSPKAMAVEVASRIVDKAGAREEVLALALEMMREAAAQHAFLSVAAFANTLLKHLPVPVDSSAVEDEDSAVDFVMRICAAQPAFREKLLAALGVT